jgi:hypothetical protein
MDDWRSPDEDAHAVFRGFRSIASTRNCLCLSLVLAASLATAQSVSLSGNDAGLDRLLRETEDPCLGQHWRLLVDSIHPERPGHWYLMFTEESKAMQPDLTDPFIHSRPSSRLFPTAPSDALLRPQSARATRVAAQPIVIRVGDPVTVDQSSPVLQARFLAVALERAVVGQRLRVRLRVPRAEGVGVVVSVIAVGTGRASWLSDPTPDWLKVHP